MYLRNLIKEKAKWLLKDEKCKEALINLEDFLLHESKTYIIYPKCKDVFNAINSLAPYEVKVVILGQDPYHEPNQAHGYCFSVSKNIVLPPSLKNIYKEISRDIGKTINTNGDLINWVRQGVMLLNTVLTVRNSQANSHKNKGWETITTAVIKKLNEDNNPKVFMLWGNNAKEFKPLLNNPRHLILESSHPSPLSANYGFLGCSHFSKANQFLKENNIDPIIW